MTIPLIDDGNSGTLLQSALVFLMALAMKGDQMFRTISLAAVCLILVTANSAVAQKKPFKNKTARAAKKSYEEAIAKAKKEYLAKLEIAIKEAGGAGDIDEANRIVAEKKEVASGTGAQRDPLEKLRKRLEGTRWGPRPTVTLKLMPKQQAILSGGGAAVWTVSDPRTVLLQDHKSRQITVWKFDERMKSARLYEFEQSKQSKPLIYKKY